MWTIMAAEMADALLGCCLSWTIYILTAFPFNPTPRSQTLFLLASFLLFKSFPNSLHPSSRASRLPVFDVGVCWCSRVKSHCAKWSQLRRRLPPFFFSLILPKTNYAKQKGWEIFTVCFTFPHSVCCSVRLLSWFLRKYLDFGSPWFDWSSHRLDLDNRVAQIQERELFKYKPRRFQC